MTTLVGHMRSVKRILILITGWTFILVGIAGLFLPILQGILFIVIGLMILSCEYVWARRLLARLRAKFPSVARLSDRAREVAERWIQRITRRTKKESPAEPVSQDN